MPAHATSCPPRIGPNVRRPDPARVVVVSSPVVRPGADRWPLVAVGLIVAAVVGNVAYLLFLCPFDLAPDEAHYWHWSRRLDWAYYSKGPLVAWLIRGSCELFGGLSVALVGTEAFAVRLPAVACNGFLLAGLYVLTAEVFRDRRAAVVTLALALTVPPLTAGAVLMTIDAPFLACWCWALVFARRAAERDVFPAYVAAGVCCGIGVLAKFPMLLLPAAVAAFLAADRRRRRQLRRPGFWVMVMLTGVGCVPVVVWNVRHDWLTVRHVLGQVGGDGGFALPAFVGGQVGFLVGYWLVAFLGGAWVFRPWKQPNPPTPFPKREGGAGHLWDHAAGLRIGPPPRLGEGPGEGLRPEEPNPPTPFPKREGGARPGTGGVADRPPSPLRGGAGGGVVSSPGVAFLWWTSVPVWAVFLLAGLRTAGQVNWPAAAYVAGFPLAVAWARRQITDPCPRYRRLARSCFALAVGLGITLTVAAHAPDLFFRPVVAAVVGPPTGDRPTPVRQLDPTCRLQGWRTLVAAVDDARDRVRAETGEDAVVAGMAWTLPGELSFYCRGRPEAFSLGLALADRHSQYDLWRPNPVADAQAFRGRTFVYVGEEIPGMADVFDRVEPPVRVTHFESGRPVAEWLVWVGYGFRGFPRPRTFPVRVGF